LVLTVDEAGLTATLRHAYPSPNGLQSTSQGSFRLQSNGDWFAGWGDKPEYTEFSADGAVVYNVKLPSSVSTYRAIRFPWTGHPTNLPAVAARQTTPSKVTVYASWNGATEVASWSVLAGPDPQSLSEIASAPKHGFETTIQASTNQPYLAVRALDASGAVLATSAPTTPRP
jgi:hypothetical protein